MPSCSPRLFLAALLALCAVTSPAHARHLRQFGSAGTGSASCLDGFNAWLQSASTCAGTTQTCCAGLHALGDPCWREVMDAAYATADQQTVNSAIQVFESCGFTFPSTSGGSAGSSTSGSTSGSSVPAGTPEQQCIDAFNQAVIPTCQAGSQDCCAAHANLGSQCLAYLAAGMAADPQYAQLYTAFTSTLTSCGIPLPAATTPSTPSMPVGVGGVAVPALPTSPVAATAPPTPASVPAPPSAGGSTVAGGAGEFDSCLDLYRASTESFCVGPTAAAMGSLCCSMLAATDAECLGSIADSYTDPAQHAEFAGALQRCGYTLTPGSAAAAGRSAVARPSAYEAAAALVAAAAQAGQLGAAGARRGTPVQPRFAAPDRGLLEQLAGTHHA